jgi:hypothetical protein
VIDMNEAQVRALDLGNRQVGRADRAAGRALGGGQSACSSATAPPARICAALTAADVALLAGVERALGTLSGPATACVLRRQHDVFGDPRFERLGSISVAHLYNLHACQATTIGVRRAPTPEGRPDFIRIDSVHQGEHDGVMGLYHINATGCVTQWQVTGPFVTIVCTVACQPVRSAGASRCRCLGF